MDVFAEYLSKRGVEQVSRGVVSFGVAPPFTRHVGARGAQLHFSGDLSQSGDTTVDLADFVDIDVPAVALDLAAVGDLTTGFGLERRL
jgi:hypothetical protein